MGVLTIFWEKMALKHILKPKGVVKKMLHAKAVQIKKEIRRKMNEKANAISTTKVYRWE